MDAVIYAVEVRSLTRPVHIFIAYKRFKSWFVIEEKMRTARGAVQVGRTVVVEAKVCGRAHSGVCGGPTPSHVLAQTPGPPGLLVPKVLLAACLACSFAARFIAIMDASS